ncbi:MAG: glycosyltransferase family 4 protein [Chloroflexi bacterium]|nr:glycosyltransferase family 4 protein [Chloroflexota bacterium]
MRIVIAKKLLSAVGGSEIQARQLAGALAARGHDVRLVGMRPPWRRPGIPDSALAGGSAAVEHMDGTPMTFVPSIGRHAGAVLDALLPLSLADDRALNAALAGSEVVHCIAREWAGPLMRAARRLGAAYVETPLVHPGQPFSGAGASDVARYREAAAVLALTEWEAAWYRARGVPRVHVTGTGPTLDPVGNVTPDPATVLFVGRKERYKGYHALRAAATLVWRERPDARFVAIGQRAWNGLLGGRSRDPRWVDLGVVDERAKAEAYARATVLAMPSEHETFGQTYLEAWAMGRPVIAGDIPPLREVVREGIDGLHAANEPLAIARAILRILADPEGARRMGEAGRARLLERWTWPVIAERTERVYLSALGYR